MTDTHTFAELRAAVQHYDDDPQTPVIVNPVRAALVVRRARDLFDALPDGCELRRLCDVPVGWQVELDGGEWSTITAPAMPHLVGLRVCRPVPDPQPRTKKVPWHKAVAQQLSVPTPGGPVEVNGCRVFDGAVTLTRRTPGGLHADVVEVDTDGTVLVEDDPADTLSPSPEEGTP